MLATTRSFRASSDRELIDWRAGEEGQPFARNVGEIVRRRDTLAVEIILQEEQAQGQNGNGRAVSKRIRINGVPHRAIDLIGQVQVVMFAPQDIDLVQGAPQLRRRYMDVTLSLLDPRYLRALSHYNRVLVQRNHLLRQLKEGRARPNQLPFWDQELTSGGSYLLSRRLALLQALQAHCLPVHRHLTAGKEDLALQYRPSLAGLAGCSQATPEETHCVFAEELAGVQQKELRYGVSLLGPHRDDFFFLVNGRDLGVYGSRGQQRTAVLSIRLAEAELVREWSGEAPILLLDDVMSELDLPRRRQIREAVGRSPQAILTTTDLGVFEPDFLASALVLRVEAGSLAPV